MNVMQIVQIAGYIFVVLIIFTLIGTTIYGIRNELENIGKPKDRPFTDTPIKLYRVDGQLYATYSPYVKHNALLTEYRGGSRAPVIKNNDGQIVEEPVQLVLTSDYHNHMQPIKP